MTTFDLTLVGMGRTVTVEKDENLRDLLCRRDRLNRTAPPGCLYRVMDSDGPVEWVHAEPSYMRAVGS